MSTSGECRDPVGGSCKAVNTAYDFAGPVALEMAVVVAAEAPLLPEVKPTRQWAAWTREEEQNFFGALRQVGKNFEKITSRVQSKNKDQVRHYYYRVIKRMNRILAPTLILDAKNSAYVNNAMLRWWSLLEKHSCSASKLRLKPRRFKTFVTALEHQLLKDHKKVKTKKPIPAGSTSKRTTGTAVASPSGLSVCANSESGVGKEAANNSLTAQTTGSGRRVAVKRKAASNVSGKTASETEAKNPPRPRKKASGQPPPGSSTPLAGLGLKDNILKEFTSGLDVDTRGLGGVAPSSGLTEAVCSPQTLLFSSAIPPLPTLAGALSSVQGGLSGGLVIIPELCAQVKAKSMALDATRCNNCSSLRCNGVEEVKNGLIGAKLKLQLFPFDDSIRKALEQEGHNPHLELTLKARKSISSVLHHLTQKWGRSKVALGELRLFPFNTQWSSVSACQSWRYQDLDISAADVHATLGNPGVFRLRYAWLSTRVFESSSAVPQQGAPACDVAQNSAPILSGNASCSGPKIKHSPPNVLPYVSTSKDLCVGSSGASMEPCKEPEEIGGLPVSAAASVKEGSRVSVQSAVPIHRAQGVDMHVAVPLGLAQKSEHHLSGNLMTSSVAVVTAELEAGEGCAQVVPDFNEGEPEDVGRANCKENEIASQVSGCGWLYESNDGFAQQLWSFEETPGSSSCVSLSQMDWVDSLTNLSVSELFGDASRPVYSAPVDCPQSCSGQTHLTCLDSLNISLTGQDVPLPPPMFMPSGQPTSTIWGGEETCDAFSFQRLDKCSKDGGSALLEEPFSNSLGLDITFADFRSVSSWRENSQNQDLLFGGEASMGLGGLIEVLAQGSLDGLQAGWVNQHVQEEGLHQPFSLDSEVGRQPKVGKPGVGAELPSLDANDQVTAGNHFDHCGTDEPSSGSTELIGIFERLHDNAVPNGTVCSEGLESRKEAKAANSRLQKKKELCPHQRSFKLPGRYNSTARSLKLQG